MMKKIVIVMFASLLMLSACQSKRQEYRSDDGQVVASCAIDKKSGRPTDWKITTADGREVVEGCDSMRVVEVSETGSPMTVCYFRGDEQVWVQYYTTMALRSQGTTKGGLREGLWQFFYPTGQVQSQSHFVGGKEEGEYVVFRENGVPYYRGQYHEGVRTGEWEVYDNDGNLAERKIY